MIASKDQIPPRIRTTPLSIFVASPFGGDQIPHSRTRPNSPGTALRSESSASRNAGVATPNMKRSQSRKPQKKLPLQSGLTTKFHSTPSLVEDLKNEQGSAKVLVSRSTSAKKASLHSSQSHGQQTSRASCRKRLAMSTSLKNYHSETSLNLLSTPAAFSREDLKPSASRVDVGKMSREEASKLVVGVRVRPLNAVEKSNPSVANTVTVAGNKVLVNFEQTESQFIYDHCFWSCEPDHAEFATQEDVFVKMVRPLFDKVFEGYNACLFAYGQTGSGKSYSIMGGNLESLELSAEAGVIPRFCHELFSRIAQKSGDAKSELEKNWKVEISYYEVYNEKIHDLLDECDAASRKCLRVREHPSLGPYVEDLTVKEVHSFDEVLGWLKIGGNQRFTAATEMNENSSRSHSIFSLTLTQTQVKLAEGNSVITRSRCNIVDLAGSERVAQTCSSGERRKEGVSINQSLLTLGKVISALAENDGSRKSFAPYRESVLTFLLKESLGGNSRTVMLATISPVSTHVDETLATLRYACQARKIINRVRVNEVPHAPVARSQTADVAKFDVLREQYEEHMKVCHQSSETQRLREELETLRRQHDDHMRGCTSPQGACLRAACAEDRRQAELQLTEHRSHHAEAVSQLKAQLAHRLSGQSAEQQLELGELKEELSAARKEYEDHLRCCRLVDGPQPEKLREELQQVTAQLSKIRSLTSEIEVLRISRDDCQVKCAELETMCKEHEKQLTELELQRMQEQSYFGSQLENFCVQLGSVQARIDDLPHYESQPLPHGEFEFSIDAHTRALMKKLMSAVSEDYANPSDCEYSMSLYDTVSYLFTKDHTETLCKKSSVSSQLNTTSGRLSTDMDESSDCLDNSQSFVSQNSSSVGNAKESVEEILYYLQDKSNMLKELCPEKNYSAAVAAFDQALYELREALQGESLPDLSQHFSPPSPSVTPAKSSLRSPAALRAPTPKSVTFRMRTGADS